MVFGKHEKRGREIASTISTSGYFATSRFLASNIVVYFYGGDNAL